MLCTPRTNKHHYSLESGTEMSGNAFHCIFKDPSAAACNRGLWNSQLFIFRIFLQPKSKHSWKDFKKQKTTQTICIYFIPVLRGEEGRGEAGGRKLRPGEATGRVGTRDGVESDLGYQLWPTTEGEWLKKDARNSPSRRVQVSAEQPRDRWTLNRQNILDWRKCQVPYAAGWQLWSSTRALEWETASVCMATVMLRLSMLSNTQIYESKPFCFYSTCLQVHLFRSGRFLCPLRPNRWW